MKNKLLTLISVALLVTQAYAQTKPVFIKGDMNIKFLSRQNPGKEGVADKYTMRINVSDSTLFSGTIDHLPYIPGTFNDQYGSLTYAVDCDVINPNNTAQTKNVGKIFGVVPVDKNNVYRFADGNLQVNIFGLGAAKGFDSKFNGLALGKPPAKSAGFFAKIKQEAINITKQVNGQTVALSVTKYDKMEFQNHILASGPVAIYPETSVSGTMLFDYGRNAWYFQRVSVTYPVDGRQMIDTLSGNIRWVEAPNRKVTGEGFYEFDIRVNEPQQSESAIFAAATDEAAFFATDDVIPALTGTMKYKDTIRNGSVVESVVTINLTGNKLNKIQAMYLAKLLFLSSAVPLNAE